MIPPEIIAGCGNRCDLCPLFIRNFKASKHDQIHLGLLRYHHDRMGARPDCRRGCDECLSGGSIARKGCPIRRCAGRGDLFSCADCARLFYQLLSADIQIMEGALPRYGCTISPADYDGFFRLFQVCEKLTQIRAEKQARRKRGITWGARAEPLRPRIEEAPDPEMGGSLPQGALLRSAFILGQASPGRSPLRRTASGAGWLGMSRNPATACSRPGNPFRSSFRLHSGRTNPPAHPHLCPFAIHARAQAKAPRGSAWDRVGFRAGPHF
jgi:hypothetical protein